MSSKQTSITEQILQLESELQESREQIKIYEKATDKFCNLVFGKPMNEIKKMISKSEAAEAFQAEKNHRNDSGVDTVISEGNDLSEGQRPSAF